VTCCADHTIISRLHAGAAKRIARLGQGSGPGGVGLRFRDGLYIPNEVTKRRAASTTIGPEV
jgi:hypothetical protein